MPLFVLYITQSLEGAEKYFLRKIEFLTKQIEKVQPGLIEKHRIRQGNGILKIRHDPVLWYIDTIWTCFNLWLSSVKKLISVCDSLVPRLFLVRLTILGWYFDKVCRLTGIKLWFFGRIFIFFKKAIHSWHLWYRPSSEKLISPPPSFDNLHMNTLRKHQLKYNFTSVH
jgi:hypothetical protein